MSKNIRETLALISLSSSNLVEKKLAENILLNYDMGVFLPMQEVCQNVNVSNAALVKFCKRLGFSGYREFIFELKYERASYFKKNISSQHTTETFLAIKDFDSQINDNILFVKSLVKKLREKKAYIFSSYELSESATFLNNMLKNIFIDVIFVEIMQITTKQIENLENDRIIILLLAGVDNNFLIDHLKIIDKKILFNNLYIIASESQAKKIDVYKKKFVLKTNKYFAYMHRRIFLDYLFYYIYMLLDK